MFVLNFRSFIYKQTNYLNVTIFIIYLVSHFKAVVCVPLYSVALNLNSIHEFCYYYLRSLWLVWWWVKYLPAFTDLFISFHTIRIRKYWFPRPNSQCLTSYLTFIFIVWYISDASPYWQRNLTCGVDKSDTTMVYVGRAHIATYPWMGTFYYPMGKLHTLPITRVIPPLPPVY